MIEFSLVVPCYNDAARLRRGVEVLREAIDATGVSWEFVFVEDCSRDDTAAELRRCVDRLHAEGVVASAIYLDRNHGHGGAVTCGIRAARGDVVGYVEIDMPFGQSITPMLERVRRGAADLVVGRRVFSRPLAGPLRLLASMTHRWYAFACLHLPVSDPECRLKVFRRDCVLPLLAAVEDRHCFWDTELLARGRRAGLAIAEWPVVVDIAHRTKGGPLWRTARAYHRAMKRFLAHIKVEGDSPP